jgi:hypothetical protein
VRFRFPEAVFFFSATMSLAGDPASQALWPMRALNSV